MSAAAIRSVRILDEIVRQIARAFYTEEEQVILDALVREKRYIKDEDLSMKLNLHHKQVRKILQGLKQQHLVKCEQRYDPKTLIEGTEENRRNVMYAFWYIDYRHFVDVVKWKIHQMKKALDVKVEESYICPSCKAVYKATHADRLLNVRTMRFECERCRTEVEESAENAAVANSKQMSQLFSQQIRPIIELLKQTENIEIPYFDREPMTSFLSSAAAASQTAGKAGSKGAPRAPGAPRQPGQKRSREDLLALEASLVVDIVPADEGMAASFGAAQAHKVTAEEDKPKGKAPVPWMLSQAEKAAKKAAEQAREEKKIKTEAGAEEQKSAEWNKIYLEALQRQSEFVAAHTYQAAEAPAADGEVAQFEPAAEEEEEEEEEMIQVGGRTIRYSEVTEEDQEKMTPEEYEAYAAAHQRALERLQKTYLKL